jgi:hypothetical protein
MVRAFEALLALSLLVGCQSKPKMAEPGMKPGAQSNDPKLTKPTVKRIWIPRKIEDDGRVMEDGHWRYEITGGSSWSR